LKDLRSYFLFVGFWASDEAEYPRFYGVGEAIENALGKGKLSE